MTPEEAKFDYEHVENDILKLRAMLPKIRKSFFKLYFKICMDIKALYPLHTFLAKEYERQLGEVVIEALKTQGFPHMNGIDYSKQEPKGALINVRDLIRKAQSAKHPNGNLVVPNGYETRSYKPSIQAKPPRPTKKRGGKPPSYGSIVEQ